MISTYRISLSGLQALPAPGATDDGAGILVLAITAGMGNGWRFSAPVLEQSLSLWEGIPCYIDHTRGQTGNRSVRDLAGICLRPAWQPEERGIRLQIKPGGPAANILRQTGADCQSLPETCPALGFSADLLFAASGAEVKEILKVFSLDLVTNPARGGRFIPQPPVFQSKGERLSMTDSTPPPIHATLQTPPDEPAQQPGEVLQRQMCNLLLETSLSGARLPLPVSSRIRKQFSNQIFLPEDLTRAIEDGRTLAAELSGSQVIQGPGQIGPMFDTRDQLQAACDDLLGSPRQPGLESLKPARLSGIRELYLALTGDEAMHGGYHPERIRLATTADFSGLVKNSLNKIVSNRWEELGKAGYNWWERIVSVEHFNSLQQITGTLIGTVGSPPEVEEGAAYTELEIGDSPETADWKKYGGYIPLTLELIDRDETRKLRAYPRELAAADLRKISALVAELFTQSSGTGPTLADGGSLFNSTAVTTAGGHKNLLTTALSASEWEAVSTAVYNQPMLVKNASGVYGTGPRMAVNPRYLLVPRNLQLAAMKVLYPTLENAANIYSENQQRGQPGDVITVPEWTDSGDWAAVCDPRIAPAIFLAERFGLMPEIFIAGDELNHAVFTNDEHRLKVRHFLAVWVNDFRPLHKSNVA